MFYMECISTARAWPVLLLTAHATLYLINTSSILYYYTFYSWPIGLIALAEYYEAVVILVHGELGAIGDNSAYTRSSFSEQIRY